MVIEPADIFGVVYAIIQVRRCVPLQKKVKVNTEANSRTMCTRGAYHGSPTRPRVQAVDKGRGSSVHDCGVGSIVQSVGVGPASE